MQLTQLSLFGDKADDWCSDDWQTPLWLAQKIAQLQTFQERVVIDAGAGVGNITRFLSGTVYAIEQNKLRVDRGKAITPHAQWIHTNYLESIFQADLIIGNPPFSLAIDFIEHSLPLLNTGGRILFLLPLDWNCTKKVAARWKKTGAVIFHEYRIEGRVAYLNGSGQPQSGRQVCDAVFDIRPAGNSAVSYM